MSTPIRLEDVLGSNDIIPFVQSSLGSFLFLHRYHRMGTALMSRAPLLVIRSRIDMQCRHVHVVRGHYSPSAAVMISSYADPSALQDETDRVSHWDVQGSILPPNPVRSHNDVHDHHLAFGIQVTVISAIRWDLVYLADGTKQAVLSYIVTGIASNGAVVAGLSIVLHRKKTAFRKCVETLPYAMRRHQGQRLDPFNRTNVLIDALIKYAFERFILITAVVCVQLIETLVSPKATWPLTLSFINGQLEANSLLASLNARRDLRDEYFANTQTIPFVNTVRLNSLQAYHVDTQRHTGIDIPSIHDGVDLGMSRNMESVTDSSMVEDVEASQTPK
ncbi:uncharacterized protein STEHIDRAFT_109605 [Stereum hirsutum FP-91666 SS1]|uniref:uncharacterized protein n=1 Tax=Stereum hirsutum (strain FP-91666) TaxID=721885 RepID=UPI000440AFDC|nr:uncharacterized protein STEHIDRAFT_109605 [Stereum hirsutum FP-91666 SS1]EIM89423.1 hypothetical protein STEHIDRAFT_109605 [Stereum hirsutum FP-91666 SS1]